MKRIFTYAETQESSITTRKIVFGIIFSLIVSSIVFLISKNGINSLIVLVSVFIISIAYNVITVSLKKADRIKKIEDMFPDFLQLMSSNLRAGMTIDRAMLLSARPEFAPLDKEILQTGRDITTGKSIEKALESLSNRIGSDKVHKTILLIISGIRSGGNIAILLEETSTNMRERSFVEKKASSTVLMYVIFIFAAISIFAPGLFALSNVLVVTMTNMLSGISSTDMPSNIPFAFTSVGISSSFVFYYSIIFIFVLDLMASLVIGLVNKGEEKQGFKYLPAILIISFSIFFLGRFVLMKVLANL